MNLCNVPKINRWTKGMWFWNEIRFNTLKEAKFFIDNVQAKTSLFRLLTKYEGYDYIAHYDYEGIITSIVEIVPDKKPYLVWDNITQQFSSNHVRKTNKTKF